MTFLRDQYRRNENTRRTLNSTAPYVGGIFPVDPSKASMALSIGASVLGVTEDLVAGKFASKAGDKGGALSSVLSAVKGAVNVGIQGNEASSGPSPIPILFQFFPESISDSRDSNIETTSLPGYSLPVPTFTGSSPRVISMSLIFSQERWAGAGKRLDSTHWDKYNVDVGKAIQALRVLCYPIGTSGLANDFTVGITPIPFALALPNTRIGIDSDFIYCFLRGYSIDYMSFFPDGQPRLAKASLTMEEMLVDLGQNVTGKSFEQVSRDYATGARTIFSAFEPVQEKGAKTRDLSVSINRFENT